MIRVNVHEAKANLSKLIERAKAGETVQICLRNEPVVEMRALPAARVIKRPFGFLKGQIEEMPGCWDPMTEEELALWYEGPIEPST